MSLRSLLKSIAPLPVLDLVAGRKGRVFALGPPKSGTTSIASIFTEYCRADHEAHRPRTVAEMHGHFTGQLSDDDLMASYRARDKQLVLDVESNCFLAYRPDLLAATFPDSRFIIAVREPRAWLTSIVDNNINFPRDKNEVLRQWHRVFFGEPGQPGLPGDEALVAKGLYPVATYLKYWTSTYDKCLGLVSESRRMVVGTGQITERTPQMLEFAGYSPKAVDTGASHRNRTKAKHDVLSGVDEAHIEAMLDEHCAAFIERHSLAQLWR